MIDANDLAAVEARDRADQFNVLLSFWLGGIIYGIYIILFVLSVRITWKTKRPQWTFSAKVFFVATFVMLVLTSIFMGVQTHRFLYAFSPEWTKASGGQLPIYYLRNLVTTWDSFLNVVIMNVVTWLADALVIYRCFIIWERNYWVILPSSLILLLSFVNCTILLVWFRDPTKLTFQQALPLLNMIYPTNIAQSCLTTGLITFKIWRQYVLSRSAGLYAGGSGNGLLTIIRIIVESAMIFALQQLLLCILYFLDSPVQYIFHGTMVPSIGAVFVLLAIRAYSVTRNDTLPNIRWPQNTSTSQPRTAQTTSTSRSPSTINAHPEDRTARVRRHRRTASDGLVLATSAGIPNETAFTLTIPDTNIYSSSQRSVSDIDLEKSGASRESASEVGGEKPGSGNV